MTPRAKRVAGALAAWGRKEPAGNVAAKAGLDARMARALEVGQPDDAAVVLERLLDVDATLVLQERRLRASLAWPAVTLVLVLCASLVVAFVAGPAFRGLPAGARLSGWQLLVPSVLALAGFAVLVAATLQRWSLGLLTAWTSLEAWAFAAVAGALAKAGVPLVRALRAGAECCSGPRRAAALSLAQQLEAGSPSADASTALLGPLAAPLFAVSAAKGAGATTLEAVVAFGDATLEREVRTDAQRLAALGLLFAALAFVATAAGFYVAYVQAAGA